MKFDSKVISFKSIPLVTGLKHDMKVTSILNPFSIVTGLKLDMKVASVLNIFFLAGGGGEIGLKLYPKETSVFPFSNRYETRHVMDFSFKSFSLVTGLTTWCPAETSRQSVAQHAKVFYDGRHENV
jgi:hypothetical protein